jgi:hypothetical protein
MTARRAARRDEVKPLTGETWDAFADLVERHNASGVDAGASGSMRRAASADSTITAPRNAVCVTAPRTRGWSSTASGASGGASSGRLRSCRGSSSRRCTAPSRVGPPDWRITCFFVDSAYRERGVAAATLRGALAEIARLGGGVVESSPETSRAATSRTHSSATRPSRRSRQGLHPHKTARQEQLARNEEGPRPADRFTGDQHRRRSDGAPDVS